MAYGALIGSSTEVPTSSNTPTQERRSSSLGSHANLFEACTASEAQALAGSSPSAARAEMAALGAKADQKPQECDAGAGKTQACEGEGLAKESCGTQLVLETTDQEEVGQTDAQLVDSMALWAQRPLTSVSEQNDQAVISAACAAWRQAQRYSQAAALSAATLLMQCLRRWFLAGGDTVEVALITQRTLIVIKDVIMQQASPTPAEAACRGRKPLPNRKSRK